MNPKKASCILILTLNQLCIAASAHAQSTFGGIQVNQPDSAKGKQWNIPELEKLFAERIAAPNQEEWHRNAGESSGDLHVEKLYVNRDSILDYFVLRSDGDPFYGSSAGFVNGATGIGFPLQDEGPLQAYLGWSRDFPYVEVVNVNCADGQQEIMVKSDMLHMGTSYQLEIYRYNTVSEKIEQILSENVVSGGMEMVDSSYIETYVAHYIGVIYSHGSCINEIKVQDGTWKEELSPFKKGGIVPRQGGRVKTFIFDPIKQTFVPR